MLPKRTLSLVSKLDQKNVQDRIKDIFLKKKKNWTMGN